MSAPIERAAGALCAFVGLAPGQTDTVHAIGAARCALTAGLSDEDEMVEAVARGLLQHYGWDYADEPTARDWDHARAVVGVVRAHLLGGAA